MTKPKDTATLPIERIAAAIVVLRGQRVLLDSDLAKIYEVETKRLNQQVTRNSRRFPQDFMFRLTTDEVDAVNRLQFATGSQKHRDPQFPPYAFTEHSGSRHGGRRYWAACGEGSCSYLLPGLPPR